jgi:hypothetical protein
MLLMSEPWIVLTNRFGEDIENPSSAQLSEAVAELYHEAKPGTSEASNQEHGSAWVRYGFDDGPMFVLDLSRRRSMRLEEWADQDFDQELAPPRTLLDVAEPVAIQALEWLVMGDFDQLRSLPWRAS